MANSQMSFKTLWYRDVKGEGIIKASSLKNKIALPESSGGIGGGENPKEMQFPL